MEKNFLDLAKEISNATGGSVENALNHLHSMTENSNYKKVFNDDEDFTYNDYLTENRAINAFIDYFIEMKGHINSKELIEEFPNQLKRADKDKLKEMRNVFHNIEDDKLKITILKNFNNLNLFKKENTKSYIDHIKEYSNTEMFKKETLEYVENFKREILEWNSQSEYN